MKVDLVVIGGGPGGYVAAIRAAQLGKRVALAEERELGGTCLNRGCIPTKTLLHSAELYHRLTVGGAALGVVADQVTVDMQALYRRKEDVVGRLRSGVETLLKQNGVTLLRGRARLSGAGAVRVEGEAPNVLETENILLATGSVPSVPPIPGIELALTSDGLLERPQEMKRLVIIGGGVIGVEFACVYSSLGLEVTVVEAMDRLLPGFDREISQNLAMILKKRGVTVAAGAAVTRLSREDGTLRCCYTLKDKECAAEADAALCAVGRRANTEGLFEGGFSVETERGRILVNDSFQTSVPGIYAIGDVSSRIQLAHVASAQGTVAVERMFGAEPTINLSAVPSCVYTDPEIAGVGMTADDAKREGIEAVTGKFLLTSFGKALIEGSERSFIKLVFDARTGRTLGAQLMCPRATDLIGELADAVANGLTREQLASVIRPHPTFCEAVTEAAQAAAGESVHSAPRKAK